MTQISDVSRFIYMLSTPHAEWSLRAVGDLSVAPPQVHDREFVAQVPGGVHTDLLRGQVIEDPYIGNNELDADWVGRTDWEYRCRFNAEAVWLEMDRVDLVCDGLDTITELRFNGAPLGSANNMYRRWRFDLRPLLCEGSNELVIRFANCFDHMTQMVERYGDLPHGGAGANISYPHNLMRKMACSTGWDWGPVLPNCGIWKAIRIEAWNSARLGDVRPLVTLNQGEAELALTVETFAASDSIATPIDIVYRLADPAGECISEGKFDSVSAGELARLKITLDSPELWWPIGHGGQPRYALKLCLCDANGQTLQQLTRLIGLRTCELRTHPDSVKTAELGRGVGMTIAVNGKPIYCKGANWIPDDCFPARITPERYRQRVQQARDAHMNMLRVWGGGLYETEAFYDACDELGVMVWQDFMFACSLYPEEQPYWGDVEAELRDNISRLADHPSLVIWNGGNECIWSTFDWGPEFESFRTEGNRTWGLNYYLDLIPRCLAEIDPSKPYWPNSPWSGNMDRHPLDESHGNSHIWDVWLGDGKYHNYLAHAPRLATEFGYHGPPTYSTIEGFCEPQDRYWSSPVLQLHNKNTNRQEQTRIRLQDDFDLPDDQDFDTWHYLAQIMQARALSMGIEWFRCLYPWNSGALYWQFNDCYPVSSWSCVDSRGGLKPLWYASRRFFAPRLLTIKPTAPTPDDGTYASMSVYLHNDHDESWPANTTIRHMTLRGDTLQTLHKNCHVKPRSLSRFGIPDWVLTRDSFLVAQVDGKQAFWWPHADKVMPYFAPHYNAILTKTDTGYRLAITALTLLRDLCIFIDRVDPLASITDQFVTLLPGQEIIFDVVTNREMAVDELCSSPVLRCIGGY